MICQDMDGMLLFSVIILNVSYNHERARDDYNSISVKLYGINNGEFVAYSSTENIEMCYWQEGRGVLNFIVIVNKCKSSFMMSFGTI